MPLNWEDKRVDQEQKKREAAAKLRSRKSGDNTRRRYYDSCCEACGGTIGRNDQGLHGHALLPDDSVQIPRL